MANAITAPSKKTVTIGGQTVTEGSKEHQYLTMEFDATKKYMFELASTNMERENPWFEVFNNKATQMKTPKHKPTQNVVLTSQIVWNGQRVGIRYYDGCDSLFISEQPKDKEFIEQLIRQTKRRNFAEGKFGVYGDEKMLLLYMMICSWNIDSPFRTRTADGVFKSLDKSKEIESQEERLDMISEALQLAKEASFTKVRIHASKFIFPDNDLLIIFIMTLNTFRLFHE